MPARVTILAGPARCGKTERLLARYRAELAGERLGSALWLVPTWRAAAEVRERLLMGDGVVLAGCFLPGVMTFAKFAAMTLQTAGLPIRPITRMMKRELVRQIIDQQAAGGRLQHFRPIAKTGGLVDLVCEFISELKRLEIWPEEFLDACTARGVTEKDNELREIYEAYQHALREHGLYDDEGCFWSARDVLAKGVPRGATSERLVVVDGFTDFTRTQHEILEILAGRAEELIVSLPLEAEPRRDDLFDKPLKTLAKLRKRHPGLVVEELSRPAPPPWPAMQLLEQKLFLNPRTATKNDPFSRDPGVPFSRDPKGSAPAPSQIVNPATANIEILAAARQQGEIEMIGARIKRLLTDGHAKPGDIAVVFRSPQEAGGLLGEVFARLGIPFALEAAQTLDRSPPLRALMRLLQLDLDDWPFGGLLAVLNSNYFRPAWQEGVAASVVERVVRAQQIPHGCQRLLDEVRRIPAEDSAEDGSYRSSAQRSASSDASRTAAVSLLEGLVRSFAKMPEKATLAQWSKAWRELAQATGLLRAITIGAEIGVAFRSAKERGFRGAKGDNATVIDSPSLSEGEGESQAATPEAVPDQSANPDRAAWNGLMKALAEGDRLSKWLGQHPPELDRREAFDTLLDILHSERIGQAGDECGYVRVLSAASVRSLRIPYVFLAGLSERAFPPPDREDRLYTDAEYQWLIEEGLPLVARRERSREEMLLFYEAITRATRRLYLSYPALDEAAQPLSPSPFLKEVEQACGGLIPRFERADLSPIPQDEEPLSEAEFRVKAVAMSLQGNVSLLAGLLARPDVTSNLVAGIELNFHRQDRDRFGPAEGVMQGEAARQRFAEKFSSQHVFSATELEQYASCPYRYFLDRILRVEPLEDLTLEFDVLQRGQLVHDVLARFHQRVNEQLGRPSSPLKLDEAEFKRLLMAAVDETLPPPPSNSVMAALGEINRRLVVQWLEDYRAQYEKYDQQWQGFEAPMAPELFEVSFGRAGAKPPSSDQPLEIFAANPTILISGRIDRIDCGILAGHSVFNVVDYKSGGSIRLTPESVADGTTLQLPLYAVAAMDLLLTDRDAVPWRAGYWYVRDDGFKPKQALRMYREENGRLELEKEWEDMRDGLADTVAALVRGIQRGQFPVCSRDDQCTGHCPFSTVCRINQVRSLEKICQPTVEAQ